jgi:hypothetical protein
MTVEAWIALAAVCLSLLGAIAGAALLIARSLGALATAQARGTAEMAELRTDVTEIKGSLKHGLDGAREGRAQLWREVNGVRERVAVVEERCARHATELAEDRRG